MLKAVLPLAFLAAGACAEGNQDLGTVLAGNKDVSKFYDLIKVCFFLYSFQTHALC